MSNRNFLLKGTLLLTLSGFLTKIIGFIYRIFLSQKIGAQGMGIYQLIFPIYTLCYALAVGGIQTALSRLAAAKAALKDEQGARDIFLLSAFLATTISIITGFFLYRHANWFAVHLLFEEQCTPLLKILAVSVPFGVFHSCVNGYYLARKKLSIPAAAQLIEQCFRVAASFVLFSIWLEKGIAITPKLAVFGLLAGELAAWLFTGFMILWDFCKGHYQLTSMITPLKKLKAIAALSFPLTCNRLLVNILHSIEAVLIPGHLQLFGLDNASSLSIYGVLTGMALPLILFPSAITNALSTVLLPSVAENQALGKRETIRKSIFLSIKYCLFLGFAAFAFFYAGGNLLGLLLFKNEFAGTFIKTLSFICPCLYLSGTLNSILNGLGAANQTFWLNTLGLGIRLLFVFFVIPHYGIIGYLWGLIISELFITLLSLYCLRDFLFIHSL